MTPSPTNRMVRAGFWTDSELMRWSLPKRLLYAVGLPAISEPTGCLEDDPWAWKYALFPADDTITVEMLEAWRDELVRAGKLIAYEVDGRKLLYLPAFHRYQALSIVGRPMLPVPEEILVVKPHPTDPRKFEVFDAQSGERLQPRPKGSDVGQALGKDTASVNTNQQQHRTKRKRKRTEANAQAPCVSAAAGRHHADDLVIVSRNLLNADLASDLVEEFGFEIALEGVRRARIRKDSGEKIHSFPALVRGVAQTLAQQDWRPPASRDELEGVTALR